MLAGSSGLAGGRWRLWRVDSAVVGEAVVGKAVVYEAVVGGSRSSGRDFDRFCSLAAKSDEVAMQAEIEARGTVSPAAQTCTAAVCTTEHSAGRREELCPGGRGSLSNMGNLGSPKIEVWGSAHTCFLASAASRWRSSRGARGYIVVSPYNLWT